MFFEDEFEYDLNKSRANARKHGIGFETTKCLWLDPHACSYRASRQPEMRWSITGAIGKTLWTAIFKYRDDKIRITSARKARGKEVGRYENHFIR